MTNLTKAELTKAIRMGITDAVLELVNGDDVMRAISEGISNGMEALASSHSAMPSVDFYEAIERGIQTGMTEVGLCMAFNPPPGTEPEEAT